MPTPVIENLAIEPRNIADRKQNFKEVAQQTLLDKIKGEYESFNEDEPLGEGTFATVYEATRKNKEVAVRVVITENEKTFRHERKPTRIFENLKNEERALEAVKSLFETEKNGNKESPKTKPDYYDYISVPKLKHQFNIYNKNDPQKTNIGYALVMESALAIGDADPNLDEDERKEAVNEDIHEYISNLIVDGLEGIKTLRSNYLIHNDIKPDNFLLIIRNGAPHFQLSDFGAWCSKKDFKKIDNRDKDEFLKKLNSAHDENEKRKLSNTYVEKKTEKLLNKFKKRSTQNEIFSSPEKLKARDAATKLCNTKYAPKTIENFIEDYNNVVDSVNKIDVESDIYSFGKTIEIIAIGRINKHYYVPHPKNSTPVAIAQQWNTILSKYSSLNLPTSERFTPRPGNEKDVALEKLIRDMTVEDPNKRPNINKIQNSNYVKNYATN